MNGADVLINCLLEQGVDTIFGYPGGTVLDIYDALYRNGKIRHVLTAHEQGAAHAADGYARATGKVGVCFATSGPGATNLVTGIATAFMDSVPLVAVTGNVGMAFLGRDSFQEIDITGITIPITKHNFIVKDVNELADTVRRAFHIANSGRKGPVLIDILKNVQVAECNYSPAVPEKYRSDEVNAEELKEIAAAINKAKRPLILAGGGVIASGATQLVEQLSEKCGCPVTYTLMGKGCVPDDYEMCLGMTGMHGTKAAVKATIAADVIIALGTRFSDRVALNRNEYSAGKTIIQVEIDNAEIDKNVKSDYHVMADVAKTLQALLPLLESKPSNGWRKQIAEYKSADAKSRESGLLSHAVIDAACKLAPEGTIAVTDVGQHQMWAAQRYTVKYPRGFISSGGLGTMGFGLGAAIGAYCGTGRTCTLITGDGCFGMNMNELMTAVACKAKIVILLMNNGVLGMVRQWQKVFYNNRFSQTTLNRGVNYVALAESMGAAGLYIESRDDVEKTLARAYSLAENGPVLVDCRISCDENVFPMIKPGANYDAQIERIEDN